MSKRVLIVENSLAVRGIAESLLRQNGYEVVAADTVDSAKAILGDSKIDLMLVASDITDGQGQKFYEFAGAESSIAAIPLLVFHDASSGEDLPFPPEAIIQKPFTPGDFLSSISVFTGGGELRVSNHQAPFDGADFEDDIIDAALGLDKIDVNESEVMGGDTGVFRVQGKKKPAESMIGIDYGDNTDVSSKTDKKIDQINVPADKPAAPQPAQPAQPQQAEFLGNDSKKMKQGADLTESSKIEIVTDQYGISLPEDELQLDPDEDGAHDYNWFINELKGEAQGKAKAKPASDTGSLKVTDPAEVLSPSAPAPASPAPAPSPQPVKNKSEGVDDFISEFKKEMEKISDDLDPELQVTNIAPASAAGGDSDIQWKESIADIPKAEIQNFSKDLVKAIATQVAAKIMAQFDEQKLYQIVKESIDEKIRDQFKKTS